MDLIKSIENEQLKGDITTFNVGDTIKVHVKIKEGNRKEFRYLKYRNKNTRRSNRKTFTVKKNF